MRIRLENACFPDVFAFLANEIGFELGMRRDGQ